MKTTVTPNRVKSLVTVLFLILSFTGYAQPDYVFRNGTLISGTDRQEGAKYRFRNIKPGTDGIITITEIEKITLDNIDGGSGFDEAFQPVINVPRRTNGYAEFQLDFVVANTTTPRLMVDVPLTAIDIDGYTYPDEKVFEYDEFKTSPVYVILYDFIGSSLDVKINSGWVKAMNKSARDYPGVDTVQHDVMFTMLHAAVTSVTFRVGADNKSRNDVQRLRSVYFRKFLLANPGSILSQSPTLNFNGKKEKNNVSLNWKFSSNNSIAQYSLERSLDGAAYTNVTDKSFNGVSFPESDYYTDVVSGSKTYAYRLKVLSVNGKVTYSQVIYFKDGNIVSANEMNIYPNVIQNGASVQVNSDVAMKTTAQVVDYSGRIVYTTAVQLNKGTNSFYLDVAGKLAKGNYLLVLPVNGTQLSEKIVIR
jgi:hypothetical protein